MRLLEVKIIWNEHMYSKVYETSVFNLRKVFLNFSVHDQKS